MPNTTNRNYPYPAGNNPPAGNAQIQALAQAVDVDVAAIYALTVDTDWVNCGAGNPNITGTAQVRRIGKQVFGKINLTYSGGWPTSQITAFALPETSFAPAAAHRMNMGGPFQATAGTVILLANPNATAVFAGGNGPAGSAMLWNGPLWTVV